MSNLTARPNRQHLYTGIGLLSFLIAAFSSACSDGTGANPNSGSMAGSSNGGSAGTSSGGSSNQAGNSANAGTNSKAGSSGMSGSASGGSAGTGGGGGTGGMACDADDECCQDPDKTEPGVCGCGIPDVDTDKDKTMDCKEACPTDPLKTEAGKCGCGLKENDSDKDGEIDCKQGFYLEAEDGVLSEENVAVVPIDDGAGGAGAGGDGAGGAGGAPSFDQMGFSIGDDAKASKGKYIESPPGFTSDAGPGPARASYELDIPEDHMYTIYGRFYTPDIDHNKFWIKVDDGTWTKIGPTSGETWFWYTFHPPGKFDMPIMFTLTKGKHTLQVASDSDGARLDRIYVTPTGDRPVGDDTTCNPPHTVPIGGVCKESCGMLQGNSCDPVMCAGKTLLDAYDCTVCCKI